MDVSNLLTLQVLALCPCFLSDLNQGVSFTRQQPKRIPCFNTGAGEEEENEGRYIDCP